MIKDIYSMYIVVWGLEIYCYKQHYCHNHLSITSSLVDTKQPNSLQKYLVISHQCASCFPGSGSEAAQHVWSSWETHLPVLLWDKGDVLRPVLLQAPARTLWTQVCQQHRFHTQSFLNIIDWEEGIKSRTNSSSERRSCSYCWTHTNLDDFCCALNNNTQIGK